MTEKQELFCLEYIKCLNATKAAINAGYSEKTAYAIGSENLKKLEIKKFIRSIQDKIKSEKIATIEEMQEELTKVIRNKTNDTSQNPLGNKLKAIEILGKSKNMFDKEDESKKVKKVKKIFKIILPENMNKRKKDD